MSDTQTQSYNPAHKTSGRKLSVWVWLVVLLVAIGVLAGAVWWAGGPAEVQRMLGLEGMSLPSLFGGSSSAPTRPATAPSTSSGSAPATSTMPAAAQERMFAEQMQSRAALSDVINGRLRTFSLGQPESGASSASVPLTATYTGGSTITGTLTLAKFADTWYFFSLDRTKNAQSAQAASPASFDSGVVSTITNQQAQKGTQDLIAKGILDGGFKTVTIDSVQMGDRTATMDVSLTGGVQPDSHGRLVCISKIDGATTYWFVASFEKR